MYLLLGLILIPIGVVVLIQSIHTVETDHVRYDNNPKCRINDTSTNPTVENCQIPIEVENDIKKPAYLYYGLANFFQNSRNYIKSRSFDQLRSKEDPNLDDCDPLKKDEDGNTLNPCGLTANSAFNDTFRLCEDEQCNKEIDLSFDDIAWDVDVNKRFTNDTLPRYAKNIEKQDFIVWMRLATYGNFHKLYRVINQDLPNGTYWVDVNASFPVQSFDGEKFVFIAETKWFGGRNRFLGYSYIIVGGICLLLSGAFFLRNMAVRKHRVEDEVPLTSTADDLPVD